jgi:hypothetical protein
VRIVTDLGLQVVNFDVLGDAGATYSAAQVARAMMGSSRPGSIILGHMNPGSAADVDAGHGIWGLTCGNAESRLDGRVSRR